MPENEKLVGPCNEHAIHLQKTLCAMRWIALMSGRTDLARAVEQDMAYIGDQK